MTAAKNNIDEAQKDKDGFWGRAAAMFLRQRNEAFLRIKILNQRIVELEKELEQKQ
jgi:hypothetical protein